MGKGEYVVVPFQAGTDQGDVLLCFIVRLSSAAASSSLSFALERFGSDFRLRLLLSSVARPQRHGPIAYKYVQWPALGGGPVVIPGWNQCKLYLIPFGTRYQGLQSLCVEGWKAGIACVKEEMGQLLSIYSIQYQLPFWLLLRGINIRISDASIAPPPKSLCRHGRQVSRIDLFVGHER